MPQEGWSFFLLAPGPVPIRGVSVLPDQGFPRARRQEQVFGGGSRCSAAGEGVESDGPSQQDGRAQAPSRCGHQNEHKTVTSSGEILLRHAKASLTNAI